MLRYTLVTVIMAASALASSASLADSCKGTTQADLNECAAADYKRSDTALNMAYDSLAADLGARPKQGLREAQRAWLAYRDKSCDLEAMGSEGGSIQSMARSNCLTKLTRQRTKMLRGYLDCQEGDMNCVGRMTE